MFRILRNIFFDGLRRRRTAQAAFPDDPVQPGMEFWQGDERFISGLTVKLEMAKLPTPQREIIALIDIAGLSYADVARCLDVPIGTVMSRISRARRALLEAIGDSDVRVLPLRARAKNGRR